MRILLKHSFFSLIFLYDNIYDGMPKRVENKIIAF